MDKTQQKRINEFVRGLEKLSKKTNLYIQGFGVGEVFLTDATLESDKDVVGSIDIDETSLDHTFNDEKRFEKQEN